MYRHTAYNIGQGMTRRLSRHSAWPRLAVRGTCTTGGRLGRHSNRRYEVSLFCPGQGFVCSESDGGLEVLKVLIIIHLFISFRLCPSPSSSCTLHARHNTTPSDLVLYYRIPLLLPPLKLCIAHHSSYIAQSPGGPSCIRASLL